MYEVRRYGVRRYAQKLFYALLNDQLLPLTRRIVLLSPNAAAPDP